MTFPFLLSVPFPCLLSWPSFAVSAAQARRDQGGDQGKRPSAVVLVHGKKRHAIVLFNIACNTRCRLQCQLTAILSLILSLKYSAFFSSHLVPSLARLADAAQLSLTAWLHCSMHPPSSQGQFWLAVCDPESNQVRTATPSNSLSPTTVLVHLLAKPGPTMKDHHFAFLRVAFDSHLIYFLLTSYRPCDPFCVSHCSPGSQVQSLTSNRKTHPSGG
ncbi:uncharacterized protein LY89DRAFT_722344 [Mollisia scopiformis]|uniref:Secreted protein n=1 Tax=Mollisia scopiformis TaxID=149040 RepID=A0A194WVE7_MOLSC|nr:uncharacterized protein LY89DRAFT_722344 [Mollisia scopiformis]KUJ11940.1 hypothetical protein LY89DRAFT_722344 [Mollisia scopiformis]